MNYTEPKVTDLMAKEGDYEEKEITKVKVDRTTNSGRRNRRRNTAKKTNRKRNIAIFTSGCYNPYRAYYDDNKGYVVYPHNSDRKKSLKKQTNKRARACQIYDDASACVCRNKLLDYKWELY